MGTRRIYGDEEKAAALAMLAANDGNLCKTSEAMNIPRKTLAYWAKSEPAGEQVAKLRQEKKQELHILFEEACREMIGVALKKKDDLTGDKAMVAAGIAADKMQILQGKPNSVTKHDTSSSDDSELAAEIASLKSRLAGLLAGSGIALFNPPGEAERAGTTASEATG